MKFDPGYNYRRRIEFFVFLQSENIPKENAGAGLLLGHDDPR